MNKIKILLSFYFPLSAFCLSAQTTKLSQNVIEARNALRLNGYQVTSISNDTSLQPFDISAIPTQYAVYWYVRNAFRNPSTDTLYSIVSHIDTLYARNVTTFSSLSVPLKDTTNDPLIARQGSIVFAPLDNRYYGYNGSKWLSFGGVWGRITGTLSDQTDLQNALNTYLPLSGGTLTGRILLPDGTSAAPALAFSSANNTGIYYYGTNVYFVRNGVEFMRYGASNVWLSQGMQSAASASGFSLKTSTSTNSPVYSFRDNANAGMGQDATNNLAFFTGNTSRLVIDANGKSTFNNYIGVGITPTASFHAKVNTTSSTDVLAKLENLNGDVLKVDASGSVYVPQLPNKSATDSVVYVDAATGKLKKGIAGYSLDQTLSVGNTTSRSIRLNDNVLADTVYNIAMGFEDYYNAGLFTNKYNTGFLAYSKRIPSSKFRIYDDSNEPNNGNAALVLDLTNSSGTSVFHLNGRSLGINSGGAGTSYTFSDGVMYAGTNAAIYGSTHIGYGSSNLYVLRTSNGLFSNADVPAVTFTPTGHLLVRSTSDDNYKFYVNGDAAIGGSLSIKAANKPGGGISVTVSGTAGTTTIIYKIVGRTLTGSTTDTTTTSTATANAVLSSTNKVTITIPYSIASSPRNHDGQAVSYYDVYRYSTTGTSPTTTGKIGTVNVTGAGRATLTFDDTGQAGDGTTPPVVNTTGDISASFYRHASYTSSQINSITIMRAGDSIYCSDCTATDGSTGVVKTYNGSVWKNNW